MASTSQPQETGKLGTAWWMVAVLFSLYVFSWLDRLILSILLEDIKAEFQFSDTQIGLITGLAFTLFYVIFSIPLGWVADKTNRNKTVHHRTQHIFTTDHSPIKQRKTWNNHRQHQRR